MNLKKTCKVLFIALLVSLSSTLYGCGENKNANEFRSMLENGYYNEAVEYYGYNKDAIGEENTESILKETVEKVYSSYTSGSLTANAAISNISKLYSIANSSTQQFIDEKTDLIESNESFKQGDSAFAEKNYSSAKSYYKAVIENDTNYQSAQSKISECDREIKKEYIAEAENRAKSGNYKSAIEYLKTYLDSFDDVSDLKEKIKEYTDAQLDGLLKDANQYIKNGDYYSAIEEIQKLSKEYTESDKLKKIEQETVDSYLKDIIPLIDDYTKDKNYSEAYMICKNAYDLIPTSDELKQRLEKLEPLKPVLLNEMKISESDAFEQLTDHKATYEDVVGNKYQAGNLYKLSLYHDGWGNDDDGYAKVFLNAQYKKMEGVIAVSDESETGNFVVKILCDDKEVYTGKFNRTTPPQKVSVDVKGKKWMQVMIAYEDEESEKVHSYAFLSQFGFTK